VFRLGALAVNGIVSFAREIGPSLLFFVSVDVDPRLPTPADVTEQVRLAAQRPDPVRPDLATALRDAPLNATEAILIDARLALLPDGDRRIACLLRGRTIEGVAFVGRLGPPDGRPPLPLFAPPEAAEELAKLGHEVKVVAPTSPSRLLP
jgi:hypothetical protein